jgi:thimet oligopeptidase
LQRNELSGEANGRGDAGTAAAAGAWAVRESGRTFDLDLFMRVSAFPPGGAFMHVRTLKCAALGVLLLAAPVAVFADAPHPSPGRTLLPVYDAAEIKTVCAAAIAKARQQIGRIEAVPVTKVNVANTIDAWNRMSIDAENAFDLIYLLGSVHTDKAARDAAEVCILQATEMRTEFMQREALYRRFAAVEPASPHARKLKRDLLDEFEDTGVALGAEARDRVKAIINRLEELRQEFDRNLRDNQTRLAFAPDELRGMPQDYLDKAKRDDKGNYLLGFDYPDYVPFMANADDEAARTRYYVAFQNRGGGRNLAIMNEITRLRFEMARLYGLPSYAHYVIRRRMAETPEHVAVFLDGVKDAVRELERREVEELRTLKAATLAKPLADVAIGRWDVSYYQEKLRKSRYAIDQEALRAYFPTLPSIEWVLHVASRLYGVKFEQVKVPTWHEDVRYYDVLDARDGKFLSGIYLDLFPRDGKYKHAAAFGVRSASKKAGRIPVSVLVTNFDRKGLTHDEVETLFHEFGHVLHGVLSRADYAPQGGTNVMRDFVEAPSQMFEEWARRAESIALLRLSCANCPVLGPDLIRRLDDARKYGMGVKYSRQHLYAAFDMALAGPDPGDALATWVRMETETPLGHVAETQFPGSFAHIAGGYAAGYYGYMWSEVLALDMLSAFGGNVMNPKVGHRFRDVILANGGQVPAQVLVKTFLGRDPSSEAFFAEITGKR